MAVILTNFLAEASIGSGCGDIGKKDLPQA